ncbi:hypothetical protein [Ectobacillus panaciterrae]|uniref:hypothetical protein n=1 Tax=Ectobacillus panaciterrae TaxID=363872 RepID=UPI000687BD8E|nr:hypothetical protein [Ectobacillus panaciterrae]
MIKDRGARRRNVAISWGIMAAAFVGFGLYKWFKYGEIDGYVIFVVSLGLYHVFNYFTWGDINGPEGRDEMNEHIIRVSAKISYYVLIAVIFILILIQNGFSTAIKPHTMPFWLTLCASIFVMPIVEFLVARKYR